MYKFFKRFFDILLSGIAIIILSPLLVPVMIILKCTGEHYIFYGQDRIGSIVFRDEESLLTECVEKGMSIDDAYAKIVSPYKGALEMWYQDHIGFWTDFMLIFLTAWVIVFPESELVFKVIKDLPKREGCR